MPRNQRLSLPSVWALSLSILYNSVFCIGHHLLERKSSSKHLLLFFALFVLQSRGAIIVIIIVIEFVVIRSPLLSALPRAPLWRLEEDRRRLRRRRSTLF